jgi:2'-5' RNA ligase
MERHEIKRVNTLLAYWLIPAEPQRSLFKQLIETLAAQHDAPVFAPHVTIFANESGGVDSPGRILEEAAGGISEPIILRVERVAFSEKYTKTLFVEFADSPQLSAISEAVQRLSSAPHEYELNPHLSLIYKHLGEAEKQALAQTITIPFSEIAFDEIKAITAPAQTKKRTDVEAWRVVHSRRVGP